ncbi:UDP-phosphate galactose phosphotransferase [Lactobacillus sp. UMNPBX5]|nr:UDP-phosphate galactose phosphotransferase [Lactobacillus sp. UMNPBX5]
MRITRESNNDNPNFGFRLYNDCIKRFFDIIVSLLLLIILGIPMGIIALRIKRDSPNEPILFRQERVGKNDVPFTIYKFRSMSKDAPHEMATENFENPEQFITPVGKFLRKKSLDELPQLFNVVKGDMSIIGPRPLIPEEKEVLKMRDELGASQVLPGITGLAQVNGRDELIGEKKATIDGNYARRVSIWLDLFIFFKTVGDVLVSRGVHEGKSS